MFSRHRWITNTSSECDKYFGIVQYIVGIRVYICSTVSCEVLRGTYWCLITNSSPILHAVLSSTWVFNSGHSLTPGNFNHDIHEWRHNQHKATFLRDIFKSFDLANSTNQDLFWYKYRHSYLPIRRGLTVYGSHDIVFIIKLSLLLTNIFVGQRSVFLISHDIVIYR